MPRCKCLGEENILAANIQSGKGAVEFHIKNIQILDFLKTLLQVHNISRHEY